MSKIITTQSSLDNLSRGWPPPASLEEREGSHNKQDVRQVIATPELKEQEEGLPSLAFLDRGSELEIMAFFSSRSREKASLERDGRRERTNEQEDYHPLAS